MARSKTNSDNDTKFENPCWLWGCHHGDKIRKNTKPWTKAKKQNE